MVDVYDEYRQQIRQFHKSIDQTYEFIHQYEQGIRPIFSGIIHLISDAEGDYQPAEGLKISKELTRLLHYQVEHQVKDEVYDVAF